MIKHKASDKWELCTDRIEYDRDAEPSMIPYHENLTRLGYRALIFRCEHASYFLNLINLSIWIFKN